MKFLDSFVEIGFKTLDDGTLLFYPWGIFGKGYVLPSVEKKLQIEEEVKQQNRIMLPISWLLAIIFAVSLINFWWYGIISTLPILVIIAIWNIRMLIKWTKGLEVTSTKISTGERLKNAAQSWNIIFLSCLEIGSLIFVLAGVFIIAVGHNIWVGLSSIAFFGLCSLLYGYMVYVKLDFIRNAAINKKNNY